MYSSSIFLSLCLRRVGSVRITAPSDLRIDTEALLASQSTYRIPLTKDDVTDSSAVERRDRFVALMQQNARERTGENVTWKPFFDKGSGHWWDPFGSHAPEELVAGATLQACIFSWAVRFVVAAKEENFTRVNKSSTLFGMYKYSLNLTDEQRSMGLAKALAEEKDIESKLWAAYGASEAVERRLKERLAYIKGVVKSSGFSRAKAKSKCEAKQETPSDSVLRTCVFDAARAGKTFEKYDLIHGGLWRKPIERERSKPKQIDEALALLHNSTLCIPADVHPETCIDEHKDLSKTQLAEAIRKGDLPAILELRWNYSQRYNVIHNVGTDILRKTTRWKQANARYKAELVRVDHVLHEGFDFHWGAAWKWCKFEFKDSSPSNASKIIHTMLNDLTDAVTLDDKSLLGKMSANCVEKKGTYCPEGHAPGKKRHVSWRHYFIWMQVLTNPLTPLGHLDTALASTLGTALFGPQGGVAGFALAQAIPLTDWIIWTPVALLLSVNIFPECRCWQSECGFRDGVCEILDSKSLGPYGWLPYAGQKCAPVTIPPDPSPLVKHPVQKGNENTPMCKIQACDKEDLSTPTSFANVTGTVGKHSASTYNCIAVSGQNLALATGQRDLFVGGAKIKDNAEGRRSLFEMIGVPKTASYLQAPSQLHHRSLAEPRPQPTPQIAEPTAGTTTEPAGETSVGTTMESIAEPTWTTTTESTEQLTEAAEDAGALEGEERLESVQTRRRRRTEDE